MANLLFYEIERRGASSTALNVQSNEKITRTVQITNLFSIFERMKSDILRLDREAIEKSIHRIESIDYDSITTRELEDLLAPLFKGYHTLASKFDAGTYVHRSRKCSKPDNIREVSYPPNDIATIGRVNESGKSIFYASVGKSVPLFELDPSVGDTITISTWKTTNEMLLNQIGYTKTAQAELNSLRDFETAHGFREQMQTFGEDNERVYGYLANCFTRKISVNQSQRYKLTILIAQRLMSGDLFNGIFYPTVKMFGNADNIALKPSFVDSSMKLVSVEFVRVTTKMDHNFGIEILDSSTVWDSEGTIEWSGRLLGWNVPGKTTRKVVFEGNEWINKDEMDRRVDPTPTTLIDINPTPMLLKFKNAYPTTIKDGGDRQATSSEESVTYRFSVHYDFEAKEKFVSFYVPKCTSPFEIAKSLANAYSIYYDLDKTSQVEILSSKSDSKDKPVSSKDMKDLKFIHFFAENFIDVNLLGLQIIAGYLIKMECGAQPSPSFNYIYKHTENLK